MKWRAPSSKGLVKQPRTRRTGLSDGSVLVIVLWIALGLVTLTLYFAHSMSFELRAADNRVAAAAAEQAIAGAVCYVSNLLATAQAQGLQPDALLYANEAIPVGDATFWLLGRSDAQQSVLANQEQPYFGLIDEAAKLDLNTATMEMLELLPLMTPFLAAAIVDWRDSNSEPEAGGAEDEIYQRLTPAYRCKNAPFETVEELRWVYGLDLSYLFGEDANLNGILDLNENNGDQSFPLDNRDGRLDSGLLEYVTVYSKQPTVRTNGSPRVNLSGEGASEELASLLSEKFDADKANEILRQLGGTGSTGASGGGGSQAGGGRGGGGQGAGQGGTGEPTGGAGIQAGSLLELYLNSGMTPTDFAAIEADLTVGTNAVGLVNVNTASQAVLTCIPGIGIEYAAALLAYRQNNRATLAANPTLTWVADVLNQTNAVEAGPYLSGRSYQFTADVAAVGHHGRGYRRVKFVFDLSDGTPRVVFRQDLTHLGWALGRNVRQHLQQLAKQQR